MNLPAKTVAWLLPLLFTGCIFHKTRHQPAPALPPPVGTSPKPTTTPVQLPASALIIPSQPLASDIALLPELAPNPPRKHRKTTARNAQQLAVNTQPPPPSEPPGVSAIGELSSGDPPDLRRETIESVAATERGLNSIDRALSKQEQKTAARIREFLKQARDALASGDVDGAHTLAAKARVLLSELIQ